MRELHIGQRVSTAFGPLVVVDLTDETVSAATREEVDSLYRHGAAYIHHIPRAEVEPLPLPPPSLGGIPERLEDGWWLLPCGLHESRRLHLHCATCERVAVKNAAAREELARRTASASTQRAARARSEAA